MKDEDYILLIDAGGSSSEALIINTDWKVLARAGGGPINLTQDSRSTIESNLTDLYKGILSESDLDLSDLDYVFLGVSGWFSANWEEGKDLVRDLFVRAGFAGDLRIYHDSITTWAGATEGETPSIVLYSGTGSFAFGQDHDGNRAYADIMGPLLGEAGSGYWIGLKSLRAAVKSREGRGERTALEDLLTEKFSTRDINEIVRIVWQNGLSRKEVASVVPGAGKIAEEGDRVALEIFETAGKRLAASLLSVVNQLTRSADERSSYKLYYSGGVFNVGEVLIGPISNYIGRDIIELKLRKGKYGPFAGGFILGCGEMGIKPPKNILDYIDSD